MDERKKIQIENTVLEIVKTGSTESMDRLIEEMLI